MLDDKCLGALYGVAMGDAFGMPVEFYTRKKIKRIFGYVDTFLDAPDDNKITHGLKRGEVTDDTQTTVLIARSLIDNQGEVKPDDILNRIMNWADENTHMNVLGPSTRLAFEQIRNGMAMSEAGKSGVTNGGAMKMIPVGIISDWLNKDLLLERVRLVCLPTHNTNIAIAGAAAIAFAVSCALSEGTSLIDVIEAARSGAKRGAEIGFDAVGPSVLDRIDLALSLTAEYTSIEAVLDGLYNIVGCGFSAAESVPTALAIVALSGGDVLKSAEYSANVGGDTDTIGAMACGICGALQGASSIPDGHKELLEKVNSFDFPHLTEKLIFLR
ncbi:MULTISPECIES: ADP-ribosylglycohydrolase family protein [unclassified Oceanispirochaeta]|uniref:ADP-ribosylglycohydrolase family protein n=1 Tax=unclassified Oceanispirochaeta TaxID=2635722 RepID=UPI000E09D971|nr:MULTISPECIES: ADP-ribosylglycohydrolase family protein [unclassified Oceanispirochaeta]MBF9017950.1 ADP-ribosylglycohydrolase family protein [Oceanispirochaeta sp. M2]NPD74461.1 ADP-ribosylglycohydrolase family protein [Oceanispirochaeta sp. M1]RDG29670.1 ADP-ribosylglycohydrolase family protein [Oceanispirochaeta sp. M1]